MTCPEPPHRTFTNFKKADWNSYSRDTEEAFALLERPSSCKVGEKQFRHILTQASKKHIPRGHIPNMIPNLSDTAKLLIRQRDQLRSLSPTDPHIRTLDDQIDQDIQNTNRQTWIHTVESCSNKYNTSQYFSLLKTLSGKRLQTPPNQPITFNSTTLTRNTDIAKAFNKQFTSIVTHTSDPAARRVKRLLRRTRPLNTAASPFSPHHIIQAIRKSGNSRATGPDGLTIHHIKHLGPLGIQYLTDLYNISYSHTDIPSIWKSAIIIPLLKPSKPVVLGTSYRPISMPRV